jgi:hypothetical protein
VKAQLEPLSKLVRLPRNPKLHNLGEIHQSFNRFGFIHRIIINDETGHIIAGEGRTDALMQKKASGAQAPENIVVKADDWYVPTDRISVPEEEEVAAAIALNRIGENEWDNSKTASILADLAADDHLEGTGFDGDDVDYLLRITAPKEKSSISEEELNVYREEKSHWRWLRLNVLDETYDKWHDLQKQLKLKNDDEFVELLLGLVEDNLIEAL